MQDEFNDRIMAQRTILRVVNDVTWDREPLFGLSRKSIERWAFQNKLADDATIVRLLLAVSAKLFFLANKSQEQISPEYEQVRTEIISARDAIAEEIRSLRR